MPVRRRTATTGFLAATLALALAGCGGGSTTTTGANTGTVLTSTGSAPPTTAPPAATTSTPAASTAPPAVAPGPELSKPAFVSQADGICQQAQAEFTAEQKQVDTAGKADQRHDTAANRKGVADALRSDVSLAQRQLGRLRALTAPAADRPAVRAYLAAVAAQLALVSRLASAIDTDDAVAATKINTEINLGVGKARSLADRIGFKICGGGTS